MIYFATITASAGQVDVGSEGLAESSLQLIPKRSSSSTSDPFTVCTAVQSGWKVLKFLSLESNGLSPVPKNKEHLRALHLEQL